MYYGFVFIIYDVSFIPKESKGTKERKLNTCKYKQNKTLKSENRDNA